MRGRQGRAPVPVPLLQQEVPQVAGARGPPERAQEGAERRLEPLLLHDPAVHQCGAAEPHRPANLRRRRRRLRRRGRCVCRGERHPPRVVRRGPRVRPHAGAVPHRLAQLQRATVLRAPRGNNSGGGVGGDGGGVADDDRDGRGRVRVRRGRRACPARALRHAPAGGRAARGRRPRRPDRHAQLEEGLPRHHGVGCRHHRVARQHHHDAHHLLRRRRRQRRRRQQQQRRRRWRARPQPQPLAVRSVVIVVYLRQGYS